VAAATTTALLTHRGKWALNKHPAGNDRTLNDG